MNKTELMEYLDEVGIHPGKQLGQNFLIDNNLLDFIVRQANLKKDELILEVGPGVGALTEHLVAAGAEVIVIEFDYRLKDFLIKRFGDSGKFKVISEDACRVNLDELIAGRDFRCIANLPYAISSVFIANLLMMKNPPKEMLFMLQKEMGERLAASTKTKNYGALSVRAQVRYDVKLVRKVSPGVFFPPPKVDSAIVSFKRRPDWHPNVVSEDFDSFIRYAFTQRRKKLNKTLIKAYGKEEVQRVYEEMNFTGNERAEELSPKRLIELAERFGF